MLRGRMSYARSRIEEFFLLDLRATSCFNNNNQK